MFAIARQSALASSITRSNTGPRWLCSMMPMPESKMLQMSCWHCSSTSSGSTAGPAEKLKIRCGRFFAPLSDADGMVAVVMDDFSIESRASSRLGTCESLADVRHPDAQHILIRADRVHVFSGGGGVE